ncbi:MAG: DUF2225 domain-containing protein [Lachnospiraceae bacterium]|nr:DUF2225 domain-containing protein [Lachnospiraceae bacterium]
MMGLLSGLSRFGLNNLENMEVYEEPENTKSDKTVQKIVQEQDYLFDKSCICPICNKEFKVRTVRSGKVKLVGSDQDLRPRYEPIDALKYDVIMCPLCGYTALGRFFQLITVQQAKSIKETICVNFTSQEDWKEIYTYDEALERYQLALANAVVKRAKSGEKAYICLKTAWILRGKAEHLDRKLPDYENQKKQCEDAEQEFLRNALDGFMTARQSESFPICGLDQSTVDYILAVMTMRFEQYDVTGRLITAILQSAANPRVKNRARELKEELLAKLREKNTASE